MSDEIRPAVLSADTTREAEDFQVQRWRAMTAADKLELVASMCRAIDRLALAGIQERHPHATQRERFLRLAVLKLGIDLATRVYPEIRELAEVR